MLTALMLLLRSLGLICGGHRAIVLDNFALRQQLAVLTRTVNVGRSVRRTDTGPNGPEAELYSTARAFRKDYDDHEKHSS